MRARFVLLVGALLVSGVSAEAAAPRGKSPAKSKVAEATPLPDAKADPTMAARALLVRELPKTVRPADRKAIEAVVAELRNEHLEAAVGLFRKWATSEAAKPMWRDDAVNAALWAFREGLLSRSDALTAATDRLRFLDERRAAIEDSVTLLRGALVTNAPMFVGRIVVLTPYARGSRGNEVRERKIPGDSIDGELRALEARGEEIRNDRNSAQAAFESADPRSSRWMQVLATLTNQAAAMRLSSPTRS